MLVGWMMKADCHDGEEAKVPTFAVDSNDSAAIVYFTIVCKCVCTD